MAAGVDRETAIANPVVPVNQQAEIRARLAREDLIVLTPVRFIEGEHRRDWLTDVDRTGWYYWPALRQHLALVKGWQMNAIRDLDEVSNRILNHLSPPSAEAFDIRGLVLGYVQSGKTANYTALIAKAADVGYRLVIVLAGTDNGLRRQTQIRLKRELVGYNTSRPNAVPLPPIGRQWHEFTREELDGDFRSGYANHAALQGSQPVLLVVKKNGPVLRRLLAWLDEAPDEVREAIPLLVVDDEADQASIDTRGTYQAEDDPVPDDYEPPSIINGLIRDVLRRFRRRAYVAYTATPYANIFIPHDTFDPERENDLYPKDFIVDLPRPHGYVGAEELFGRLNPEDQTRTQGLDVVRTVSTEDLVVLQHGTIPPSLEVAVLDFVLAGAGRAARGDRDAPATMLVHVSRLVMEQQVLANRLRELFEQLRDEWRYDRATLRERLANRWATQFQPVTRAAHVDRERPFDLIEPHLGPFFEAVQIRVVNSQTGEGLDYEREPSLKAIAVGGNRLARGLTLEGLLISYFVRRSATYDTLMQMGRWFGFREGYEDLTRLHTTLELASWFTDLAFVEFQLREDLQVYEQQGLTPYDVGMRIWSHPTMQVTAPLKRRFAERTELSQSYSGALAQTFKFPLSRLDTLALHAESNRLTIREYIARLGDPASNADGRWVWKDVPADIVMSFLRSWQVEDSSGVSLPLIRAYIERLVGAGELVRWTVAARGLQTRSVELGTAEWGSGVVLNQISRTRILRTDSLGVITSPGDEAIGLTDAQRAEARRLQSAGIGANQAARYARPPEEALLLLYPISRRSRPEERADDRKPLYDNLSDPRARDLIAIAISFPPSRQNVPVRAYLEGTARWRPVDE
ncbi:MAG TPA: Z1 domain-containing protein [Thermoanaerobaculia bacterium]